ncbi:MAG: hypothetical protein D6831_02945 [Aquificota bacterium]|nr:MAG: hypothetical protein D6831_02945 [Aquificota bacterium]
MENYIIGAGVSVLAGIFIYLFRKRFDNIDEDLKSIGKDLNEFKLHVAEEFVSKKEHEKDLNSLKELVKEGFRSIHKRFDRFEEYVRKELDGKEDKK